MNRKVLLEKITIQIYFYVCTHRSHYIIFMLFINQVFIWNDLFKDDNMHFRSYQHKFVFVDSKSVTPADITLAVESTLPVICSLTCRVILNSFEVIFTLDLLLIIISLTHRQMNTYSRTSSVLLVVIKGRHKWVSLSFKCGGG